MMTNIADENAYMHYLKQLAQLEDANTNNNVVSTEFQITHFKTDPPPKQRKIKRSTRQIKHLKNTASLAKSKNVEMHRQDFEVKFLGAFSSRRDKRKTTLKNFKKHCSNEDLYAMFLKVIFDLEESLIIGHTDS